MIRRVSVDIDESVMRYFSDNRCLIGLDYVYSMSRLFEFHLTKYCLTADIRSYYSPTLKSVCIHINLHEDMDMYTRKQTKDMIDTMVYMSVPEIEEALDLECMRLKQLSVTVVYSWNGVILY